MQEQIRQHRGFKAIRFGVVVVWAALAVAIPQANANYGNDDRHGGGSLVGAWLVSGMPKNCVTGDPIPGAEFEALINFHEDSTMDAWLQNRTITTTRSPNYGSWKRLRGPSGDGAHNYTARFIHLRYSATTGAFAGRQYSQSTIVLNRRGDEFTTEGRTRGFNPEGVLEFEGCSTMRGSRIEAE